MPSEAPHDDALHKANTAIAAETAATTTPSGWRRDGLCLAGSRTVATTDVHSQAITHGKQGDQRREHGAPSTIAATTTGSSTAADRMRF